MCCQTVTGVPGIRPPLLTRSRQAYPAPACATRVVALDLPGFGRSEPGERPGSVPANVAVLARFLEQEIGEPVVLVGNSMGGMISILLTGERPDLVSGL